MQNVRSKSTTPGVYEAAGLMPRRSTGSRLLGVPATAVAGAAPAPSLRLVPGRIALFLAVMSLVALLLVPRLMSTVASVSAPQVYVVERGETLWAVAGRFGGDQDPRAYIHKLLELNRMSSPQLVPGQTLILP
jgi:nucleoid-associated protein YgaU